MTMRNLYFIFAFSFVFSTNHVSANVDPKGVRKKLADWCPKILKRLIGGHPDKGIMGVTVNTSGNVLVLARADGKASVVRLGKDGAELVSSPRKGDGSIVDLTKPLPSDSTVRLKSWVESISAPNSEIPMVFMQNTRGENKFLDLTKPSPLFQALPKNSKIAVIIESEDGKSFKVIATTGESTMVDLTKIEWDKPVHQGGLFSVKISADGTFMTIVDPDGGWRTVPIRGATEVD